MVWITINNPVFEPTPLTDLTMVRNTYSSNHLSSRTCIEIAGSVIGLILAFQRLQQQQSRYY